MVETAGIESHQEGILTDHHGQPKTMKDDKNHMVTDDD